MFKTYIGTKIIQAKPKSQDGHEGYEVLYSDGYKSWSPKKAFEESYRLVSPAERQLIDRGNDEAMISSITDSGEHCSHAWHFDPSVMTMNTCPRCGALAAQVED